MFKVKSTVGSSINTKALALNTILQSVEWPEEYFFLSTDDVEKLKELWYSLKGPFHDSNNFAVCYELACWPGCYAYAEYNHGEFTVKCIAEDEIDEDLLQLIPLPPVLKASKKVMPNEKCPCQSGKKYKKCCQSKGV